MSLKKLRFFDIHNVRIVSSVSAGKLKCPSSARLGLAPSQLGLARAGKFQLELISTRYYLNNLGLSVNIKRDITATTTKQP